MMRNLIVYLIFFCVPFVYIISGQRTTLAAATAGNATAAIGNERVNAFSSNTIANKSDEGKDKKFSNTTAENTNMTSENTSENKTQFENDVDDDMGAIGETGMPINTDDDEEYEPDEYEGNEYEPDEYDNDDGFNWLAFFLNPWGSTTYDDNSDDYQDDQIKKTVIIKKKKEVMIKEEMEIQKEFNDETYMDN